MKSKTIFDGVADNIMSGDQLPIVILILAKYNCRSSEVLSGAWKNFFPGQMLILKGKKRSQDVIIRDSLILKLITELPKVSDTLIFPNITYARLYTHVKQCYGHQFLKYKGKCNEKITHGFRYVNANLTDDAKSVKSILHHNAKSTGKYYNKRLDDDLTFNK